MNLSNTIKNTIKNTIQKHNMLSPGDHILAAVSGGADSVALLYCLLEILEADFNFKISVCHINHNLRGEDSKKDENFVSDLCSNLHLPLFSYSVNVDQNNGSLEEAAREVRYLHLQKAAKESGANKIATGHNQNDNAETLLLRLCRGTGPIGLCGIPPVRKTDGATLIRPLIETCRDDIESYLLEKNIPHCTDKTNFDRSYARNRIRLDVVPSLKQINPKAIMQITKSAELIRESESLLEALTTETLKICTTPETDTTQKGIYIPTLLNSPPALQRRVIRDAIKATCEARPSETPHFKGTGLKNISSVHIDQIQSLLLAQSGKEIHLPGGIRVRREYDNLLINLKKTETDSSFCYDLHVNTPVLVPILGHYVQTSVRNPYENSHENPTGICTKYFNYDKIRRPLQLRTRRPGDRINFSGNKKLKDEFIDRKIPRSERDQIPLLASGSDVLWIIGKDGTEGRTSDAYAPIHGCKVLKVEVLRYERNHQHTNIRRSDTPTGEGPCGQN